MLTLHLSTVHGNSQYAGQRGVDANEGSIIGLNKQSRRNKNMAETLGVAKSTIFNIPKKEMHW